MRVQVPTCIFMVTVALNSRLPSPAAAEWLEHRKLFGSDISSNDVFGEELTIDGDRLAVGADQGSGFDTGKVYIFERNAGGPERWGEVARLKPSDGQSGWLFGTSLALDGERLAVAAAEPDLVYVFDRQPDGTWLEVARVEQPPDPQTQTFATCVAIEGDTLFVGSEFDDEVANDAGALWVFERDAGGPGQWGLAAWSETAKLTSPDSLRFGDSVAARDDLIAVGAEGEDEPGHGSGAAYLFARSEGRWIDLVKLEPDEIEHQDNFGVSVAVGARTVVVGSYLDDDRGGQAGAAYVYLERDLELAVAGACPGELTLDLTGATAARRSPCCRASPEKRRSRPARAPARGWISQCPGCAPSRSPTRTGGSA